MMFRGVCLVLDVQHQGRPSRPSDFGAEGDVDGDGRVELDEREAALTARYAAAAAAEIEELAKQGSPVSALVLQRGEYSQRHQVVNDHARRDPATLYLYVACHLNAVGPSPKPPTYGLIVHDQRSRLSRQAIDLSQIVDRLAEAHNELAASANGPRIIVDTDANYPRALSCIRGIYEGGLPNVAGLVFEPAFITTPAHRPLLTAAGLERIGSVLAAAANRLAWNVRPTSAPET